MYIYWLGESSFKIKTKETTLVIDPAAQDTGLPQFSLKAEIILISGTLNFTLKRAKVSKQSDSLLIVEGPGEYESHGIFIYGIHGKDDHHTLYLIKIEGLKIAHLAGLSDALNNKQLELFEGVDIVLVPVGNKGLLSGKQADNVISQIEPAIVIPMNYKLPKLKIERDPADEFLSEMGVKGLPAEKSLNITKAKLPQEETKIILLQPSGLSEI